MYLVKCIKPAQFFDRKFEENICETANILGFSLNVGYRSFHSSKNSYCVIKYSDVFNILRKNQALLHSTKRFITLSLISPCKSPEDIK